MAERNVRLVNRRDGRVVTVTAEQADNLLKSGGWSRSESTGSVDTEGRGTLPIQTGYPDHLGGNARTDFGGEYDTSQDFGGESFKYGGTWEPTTVQVNAPDNPRVDSGITTAQWQQIVAFQKNMEENEGLFWKLVEGENGEVLAIHPRSAIARDFENDLEDRGWSDVMIGAVSDWYYRRTTDERMAPNQDFDFDIGPGGGGGGGGGRATGPVYIAPDRRAIEDNVKAQLMTYTGEFTDQRVAELADAFEAAHREDWDTRVSGVEGRATDPNQVVLDLVRGQENYKKAHALRGDGDDEARWIGDRRSRLGQLGVTSEDADSRAITMAQLGTNLNDIETGQFQNSKGRQDITLMNTLQKAANQVAEAL